MIGSQLDLRGGHSRERVTVELWQIGHDARGLTFSTSGQRGDDTARVVTIPIPDILKLAPARRAGDYFTRNLVTLDAHVAVRHRLTPLRPRVFVDALFRFPSRDPQAFRVGLRHDHHWCHLFCEPGDEPELHAIAERIGMRRAWFQNENPEFPHYDLVPPRRLAAVRAGAQQVELRAWLESRRTIATTPPAGDGKTP